MEDRVCEAIRRLPRGDLETFAIRAAFHARKMRKENVSGHIFLAAITGLLFGAVIGVTGFLLGSGLG